MDKNNVRPRVSVIVPNYMHGRFLDERIQSIVCQSFQDIEIILLDDASTDNSKDVIEKYSTHPKVSHVHFNELNTGKPFLQWKRGMELARGTLIWIAESDDVADPQFLATMVRAFDRNSDLVLATAMLEYIDEKGQSLGFVAEDFNGTYEGKDVLVNGLGYRNCIRNASAVVFDKQVGMLYIDNVIGRRYCGDWHFWALMAMHPGGRMHFNTSNLCYYRLHQNSVYGQTRGHRRALPAIEAVSVFCDINLRPEAICSRGASIRKFILLRNDIWFWFYGVPPNARLVSRLFFCSGNGHLTMLLLIVLMQDILKKIHNRASRIIRSLLGSTIKSNDSSGVNKR